MLPLLIKDIKKNKKLRENGAYATAVVVYSRALKNGSAWYYRYIINDKEYVGRGGGYKGIKIGDTTKVIYYLPDPDIAVILAPDQDSF